MNAAQEWQGQPQGGGMGGGHGEGWQPGANPGGAGMGPGPAGHPFSPPDPRRKSPFLAALLSAMPGLGQIYVGFYQRGFTHALIFISLITALASGDLDDLTPFFGVGLAFFWLYNVIDASRRATLYNQALMGVPTDALPADFKMPGGRGSLAGGVALAGIGFILLLNTKFHVDLYWIEDWWPAGLILLGLWLAFKNVQERRKS